MTRWYHIALACLVAIALYWPGLQGPFVFDSTVAIPKNIDLANLGGTFDQWRVAIMSSSSGVLGRPISMFSFALNQALAGGPSPWAFKFVNVLIHCLIAVLAWQLFSRLIEHGPFGEEVRQRGGWIAFSAAVIWLLHPLNVSSVLYVVQRMEQLSVLFILAGLLWYLSCRVRWRQQLPGINELSRCAFGLLLCLGLALFSKEDGLLLLPLLALLELLIFRCEVGGREVAPVKWACWLVLLSPLLVGLLLALWQPALLLSMYEDRGWNLEQRLWSQARVLWQYVGWFFYPDIRGMGLHHDDFQVSAGWLQPFSTLPAVVGWLCLLAALLLRWRVWPLPLFAAGLFLLSHAVEANVIPLEMVYEHRNYLGGLGLSLLLAWCLWIVVPMATPRPRLFATAAVGLLLSLLLLARTSLWSDELEMAEFHLYYHPQSLRSVYHYANTRLRLGEASVDQEQAQEHLLAARRYYRRMLEIDQEDVAALVTLQYLDGRYFSSLDSPEWRQRLLAAVRDRTIGKADINALNLLFDCEARGYCGDEGESSEALLLMLADRYPTQVRYRDLLARLYGQVRADYARAIKLHQGIVDTNPDYLPAHYGLIAWYTRSGQHGQALQAIGRLLEADPSGRSLQRIQLMFSTGARG